MERVAKSKTYGSGKMYRAKAVSELKMDADSVVSDRKQLWMRIFQIVLPLITVIPFAMPMWKYYAWGVVIPLSFILIGFLDYMNHFRHIWDVRDRQLKIILKDDEIEVNYLIVRPDRWDMLSPYVLYLCCCVMIISFFQVTEKYDAIYGDSVLAERLRGSSAEPNDLLIANDKHLRSK